jgi:hypothetical protein
MTTAVRPQTLEEALADRQRAEDLLEEGWAGTFLVEPLSAVAGGILGGALVTALGWRLAWRAAERRHTHTARRHARHLRNLAARQ